LDHAGPQTLGALLRARSDLGDVDALVLPGRRVSYADLNAAARRWAKAFIALGIVPGDHVGLLFNTCTSFVEALFGAAMAGAAVVPVTVAVIVPALP